ncbi:MtrAB system histidine kinase MtrB [Streptomyces albireticuli]|uniref:Sensor histidine kinase MtrB n=1 Tax=Streptomyces albireticuli TaxID=1940 RepID=A0A2A2DDH7_9ACTN|nr:MtrAB system histidine kinase MtrB [Streptomyces albireticuli]MCD9145855.1 ATP-binding protein [Streptomyces albireticuli]MCD9165985.1 ATP-binding protein [Streptomyces albireticuli]MCD9196143.1 ATP-binding protein [Streptomyces albireticuli]PAU49449.1 two-component sensor histidine kinase [Streptomyces albireticuli]
MSGNGAAPERGVGRPVDTAGGISLLRRLWRAARQLPDGAASGPVHPVLRLYVRWVRRPLLPAMRLWRRNIQLRVVATTLLMSLGVVLLLGVVVIGQVRNGLLEAKRHASQSQAEGGFKAARDAADTVSDGRGGQDGAQSGGRDTGAWLTGLVQQLASGGQGVYHVVALSSGGGDTSAVGARGPRASGDLDPEHSIPADLRKQLDLKTGALERSATIKHSAADEGEPALVVGKRMYGPDGKAYQLYYLFPYTQEEKSLKLVKGTLLTAGVFVVVLLGAIAWLVVRQIVTPVRMAASISERLAAGVLQERMKVTGEDDIARLGEAFNKMAQNLQVKIQQLEQLSRMQRRFVSDVSHELRTPLTTVRMAAEVIHEAREDFDPVTARSAELLYGQVDRFESLLADLLEISRFDAGAAALEAEPVDLRDVVHRVVDGALPLAERKGTKLLVRGGEQPVVAEADSRRVERVLRNLVVNAVEHGEGRDVVVRLATAGGAVAVAVRDYGVGLKPGEATRVFNRFWRADPARARTTGGTGLGLSIAVEDARLHGGWLQAWGEPGGGSQFRLTLPRTAGDTLRGSPIPLEPDDSRRNRGMNEAGVPLAVSGRGGGAPVPAAPTGPSPVPAQTRPTPTVDPTALPGSGARVVPRPGGAPFDRADRPQPERSERPEKASGAAGSDARDEERADARAGREGQARGR